MRRVAVLLLGLALSACASTGQIANLTETRRATVAVEAVEGAPAAVVHKFVAMLKDEAATRQIAIVSPREANYRVRGYLATQDADGAASTTSVTWALDVYGADRQRAVRLGGEEKAAGPTWAQADDEALRRIARAGMERLAAFLGTGTTPPITSPLGSLDDWTPEASGIFRILRGEPARAAVTADAAAALPPDEVPLPRRRPAVADAAAPAAFAFAPEN